MPMPPKDITTNAIRLSQCMIVKNEEKNIEKALSWAKDIAFEQIIVDTGSTDRTVEIAEALGAKVFRFEWINDFSAAKNFAIGQCTGRWIAFLDADEYFSDEDAGKLTFLLRSIENDPNLRRKKTAIRCPIVNVDENGKPFLVLKQDRVFRNAPEIRYIGKIHEYLDYKEPYFQAPEISVIHTGYANNAYKETDKATRNIEMIRAELSRDPDNVTLKCYLADSLRVPGETQNMVEAEVLYREVIANRDETLKDLKQGAYNFIISLNYEDESKTEESFKMCVDAYNEYPENPDFCFYYGRKLHLIGDFACAWEKLQECENLLKRDSIGLAGYIIQNPSLLFYQMTLTAEALGDMVEVIRCSTLVLREDKYQQGMLVPYINAFSQSGYDTTPGEIYKLLNRLYDLSSVKDKILILRAAKDAGNSELFKLILSAFTKDELAWLTENQG